MDKNSSGMQRNFDGNFISDVIFKIRLVIKLIQDDRIGVWLKAIPVLSLLYLIVPFDLLIGPIDDAVVLYFGMDIFINLCPQEIVNAYISEIKGRDGSTSSEDIIDAEFKEKE